MNQKALIIAEKPSVARDIASALGLTSKSRYGGLDIWEGPTFLCSYARGHLLVLKEPQDYRSDWKFWREQDLPMIPPSFGWKPKDGSQEHLRALKDLIFRSDVSSVINACDAGREGELIFRLIYRYSGAAKPVKRVWLQSLLPEAIQEQFRDNNQKESAHFDGLANAAKSRSYIDWLFGMNLSRLATLKLSRPSSPEPWSVGRVQSPVLAAIVQREKFRRSFVSTQYQTIVSDQTSDTVQSKSNIKWFVCDKAHLDFVPVKPFEFLEEAECRVTLAKLIDIVCTPESFAQVTRNVVVPPPQLFDLSELQQHMSSNFSWTAKQTLTIAQECYENAKVLSYPRTDSKYLPHDYADKIADFLQNIKPSGFFEEKDKLKAELVLSTTNWKENSRVFSTKEVTDHFAIIPTSIPQGRLTELQNQLYLEVVSRTLTALSKDQIYLESQYRCEFLGTFSILSNPIRWQISDDLSEDTSIPNQSLLDAESLPRSWTSKSQATMPPPNYSESDLISLMSNGWPDRPEKIKLGTAATRADIIESLKDRNYVTRDLRPTAKAFVLVDQLAKWSGNLMTDPILTSKMEYALDKVESLSLTSQAMLERASAVMTSIVTKGLKLSSMVSEPCSEQSCPKCLKFEVAATPWVFLCKNSSCDWSFRRVQGEDYVDLSNLSRWLTMSSDTEDRSHSDNLKAVRHTIWGNCPIHKGQDCLILETKKAFICETRLKAFRSDNSNSNDSEGIMLPKTILGRAFKASEVKTFIADGLTPSLTGFKSKDGLLFAASVRRLKAGGWEFVNRRWDSTVNSTVNLTVNSTVPNLFQENLYNPTSF